MTYIKAEQFPLPGVESSLGSEIGGPPKLEKEHRFASILNKAEVKRRLLQYAADTRAHKFTRVSALTLECLEARVENMIRGIVKEAPSRGQTL